MPFLYPVLALIIVVLAAWLIDTQLPAGGGSRTILNVVLGLIAVGILLWLINTYVPMARSIKVILNIVVVAATCVKVLQAVGLWDPVIRLWGDLTHHRTLR